MSAHVFFTELKDWETGDLVCVDSSTGYAIHYDSENPLPVVGSAMLPIDGNFPNGRNYFAINGPPYYENDYWVWNEDLTGNQTTENLSYTPFNPLGDSGYITAFTNGISAVKKSISVGIPTEWIKLKNGTTYDWYLIR